VEAMKAERVAVGIIVVGFLAVILMPSDPVEPAAEAPSVSTMDRYMAVSA
jgi:hypothetical protein